jgi:hypothetical protein
MTCQGDKESVTVQSAPPPDPPLDAFSNKFPRMLLPLPQAHYTSLQWLNTLGCALVALGR